MIVAMHCLFPVDRKPGWVQKFVSIKERQFDIVINATRFVCVPNPTIKGPMLWASEDPRQDQCGRGWYAWNKMITPLQAFSPIRLTPKPRRGLPCPVSRQVDRTRNTVC